MNPRFTEYLGTDEKFNSDELLLGEEYAAYRKEWKRRATEYDAGAFPLHVDIELNSTCNLRCKMCYRQRGVGVDEGVMALTFAKRIIDECATIGVKAIKFQYRGEPLLYAKLPQLIKYANDKGILETMINTNGMLLTPNKSKGLICAGLTRLAVSIDGITDETYAKIRTGGVLSLVEKNVFYFHMARNSAKKRLPLLRVQMVEQDANRHEVGDFVKMWKQSANRVAVIKERRENLDYSFREIPCPQIYQRLVVLWNGDILACCGDHAKNFVLGNIVDNTLTGIWQGAKLTELRDGQGGLGWLPEHCAACQVNKIPLVK